MEGQDHTLDSNTYHSTTEQLASADGQATLAQDTVASQTELAGDIGKLAPTTPHIHRSKSQTDAPLNATQAHSKSRLRSPTPESYLRISVPKPINARQASLPLPPKRSLTFIDSKTEARPTRKPPSRFSRSQDPRLPFFLGRHPSVTENRSAPPLLSLSSRSRINSHVDQNNDPNIFIGTSSDVRDAAFRKQPVLVPRLIQQSTRIVMTSSEMSIDGSYTSVSPPISSPVEEHRVHPDNRDQASLQDTATAMEAAASPHPENLANSDPSQVPGGPLPMMVAAPGPGSVHSNANSDEDEEFPMRPKRSWLYKFRKQIGRWCNCVG